MRYFGAHPHLSKDELARLVEQEGPDHLALVAELAGQLVGVAQYDRIPGSVEAEVAFVVDDAHQGLGIGTLLLKYLASEGRRFGLKRFAADTLFENSRMVNVFRGAGFTQHSLRGRRRPGGDGHFPHHRCSPCALRARPQGDRPVDAAPAPTAFRGGDRRLPVTGDSGPRTGTEPGQWRFPGPVYPVNPTASHIASVPSFPGIDQIPGEVDLAIVAVPAHAAPEVVAHCGRKGVGGLVIVSSHFAEDGADGAALEREVARLAHAYGMRVVGPNCFGVLNTDPAISLNATFAKDTPTAGSLGFASESGGLGIAILAEAKKRGIGLSSFVSMGNKADVSGNDLLSWWSEDDATSAGLLYLESFGNPRRLARLARDLSRSKPVIAVKSGRSAVGRRAAFSHTAALASSDDAVTALFHQTGVTARQIAPPPRDCREAQPGTAPSAPLRPATRLAISPAHGPGRRAPTGRRWMVPAVAGRGARPSRLRTRPGTRKASGRAQRSCL